MDLTHIVQSYERSLNDYCTAHRDKTDEDSSVLAALASKELQRARELLLEVTAATEEISKPNYGSLLAPASESAMDVIENKPLPKFNGNIVEALSCVITDDNISDVSLVGEIAINGSNWTRDCTQDLYMRFNNASGLKTNEQLLQPVAGYNNVYKILRDVSWVESGITTGLAKYSVTDLPQVQCPILVTPVWQFKETETISMVNLRPLIPVDYTILKVCIKIGTDAQEILSRPAGIYNKTDGTIQWDLPNLEQDQILILRFTSETHTGRTAQEAPHVRIDFTASQLLTQVKVQYGASPTTLTDLPLNVMTISGNYKAKS